jgi:hypothetical protein
MKLQEAEMVNMELITEKSEGEVITKIRFPFIFADVVNKNNRLYGESIVKRAIERLQKKMKEEGESIWGTAGHKKLPELDDVTHLIKKIYYDRTSKTGIAESLILPNARGENIKVILKAGGKLGASLRGYGTVMIRADGIEEVNDDFELQSVDIVLTPSFDTKFGRGNVFEKSEDRISGEKLGLVYEEALSAGFNGTFEQFCETVHHSKKRHQDEQWQEFLVQERILADANKKIVAE